MVDNYNVIPPTPKVDYRSVPVKQQSRTGNTTVICLNNNCEFQGKNNICTKHWIKLNERRCVDFKGG